MIIEFDPIWIIIPCSSIIYMLFVWRLARRSLFTDSMRGKVMTVIGVFIAAGFMLLPFFSQPRIGTFQFRLSSGIPITAIGLVVRLYSMMYLRKQGTTTTFASVDKLIQTGPYRFVRHPQYSSGIFLTVGWYLLWGAAYALLSVPLVIALAVIQALVEEKCVLVPKYGAEYSTYKAKVGMILPRLR